MPLNILYLGLNSGTSRDRANAYRRLGHTVTHIDLRALLPSSNVIDQITWHVGDDWLAILVRRALAPKLTSKTFDLCHVDSGEWVTTKTIDLLKKHCRAVINYNIDDPTGNRDFKRFRSYRKSLHAYDLVAVVRSENILEAKALGAKRVVRVFRSSDELTHRRRQVAAEESKDWRTDVLFVGTWMPERGPFLVSLLRAGVPLSIRGSRWSKAPEWEHLRPHWLGGHVEGDDYALAIQSAKVNLGLLSHENRDRHTTRSVEIPAIGGLLCAQRTDEHAEMYEEGAEALFWSDVAECSAKCKWALEHPIEAQRIALSGHQRHTRNGYTNERVCETLIKTTFEG